MSNIAKIEDDILGLIHNQGGELIIPKPFEQEIFLFETYVAGTSFIKNIAEIEKNLNIDDKLNFFREIENKYDDKAIVIKNKNGEKIGYVPKDDNVIFSRLMDAGKLIFGKISKKDIKGKWVNIKMKIYLKE